MSLWSLSPYSANISLWGCCNLEHSSTHSKIWAYQAITGSCCAHCTSLSNCQISGPFYYSEYWSIFRSSTRLSSDSSRASSLQRECWTFLPTFASNLILCSFVSIWCGIWLEKARDNSRIILLCIPGEGISGHLGWKSAALCWRTSTHAVCNGPKRSLILFIPVSTIWWAWKSHPVQKLDTLVSCCCSGIWAVSLCCTAKSTITGSLLLPTPTPDFAGREWHEQRCSDCLSRLPIHQAMWTRN